MGQSHSGTWSCNSLDMGLTLDFFELPPARVTPARIHRMRSNFELCDDQPQLSGRKMKRADSHQNLFGPPPSHPRPQKQRVRLTKPPVPAQRTRKPFSVDPLTGLLVGSSMSTSPVPPKDK